MPTPLLISRLGPTTLLLIVITLLCGGDVQAQTLNAEQRAQVVRRLSDLMVENYVFAEAAEECAERLADELESGKLDGLDRAGALATRLTSLLQEVTHDKHLRARPGGAHPGGSFGLPHGMSVFISTGRALNPVTGTNGEGTGVQPDVSCDADAALDRALELAQQAARQRQDQQALAARG